MIRDIVQRILGEEMLALEARSTDIVSRDGAKLSVIQPFIRDGVPIDNRIDYATPLLERVSARTGIPLVKLQERNYVYWLGFMHGRYRLLCGRDPHYQRELRMAERGEVFDPAIHDCAYRHGVFPRAGHVNDCTPDNRHEAFRASITSEDDD